MQAQLGTVNAPLAPNGEGPSPAPTMALRPEYKLSNLTYDKNGNLQTLKRGGQSTQLLDDLSYNYATDHDHKVNNRLGSVTDAVSTSTASNFDFPNGQATDNYGYNGIGQLTKDALENRYFSYFANGRVKGVYSDAAKSVALATYTYDAGGNRLMKESYANDGVTPVERTWYLRDAGGTIMCQRQQALIELTDTDELPIAGVGSYMRGNGKVRYTLTDQLGNTRVSFTATSTGDLEIIEAHDYYPHGGLLPGRQLVGAAGSPLSYQGQEYDQEVGLTAFNLRQYDARLSRWLTTDPYGQHYSPYLAMSNNPVSFVDPDGGFDYTPQQLENMQAQYKLDQQQYLSDLGEFHDWTNFEDDPDGWLYGSSAFSSGLGKNADGSIRDMDAMIRMASTIRSMETGRRMQYNNQSGQWGYWKNDFQIGRANSFSSFFMDETGTGHEVEKTRAWNGLTTPTNYKFPGFSGSTISQGKDGGLKRLSANSVDAGFYPTQFGNANIVMTDASTIIGVGQSGLNFVRQYPNGPGVLGKSLSYLTTKRVGTESTARFLKKAFGKTKTFVKALGFVGVLFSFADYGWNFNEKSQYEHLSFWTGLGVLAIALNPATASVGIVYGAAQVASYLYNGKTAEENIGRALGY